MTIQLTPVIAGQVGEGDSLRDRQVLGVANTLRPNFSLREPLDGTTIEMEFTWLQTADMWVMDVRTDDGTDIRTAVGLVASGVDLWATFQHEAAMPGGQLWIAWGDHVPRAPGRDSWRSGATLYYRPAALRAAVAGTDLELF